MNKVKVTSLICGGMISLAGPTLLGQSSSTSPGQTSSSSLGQSSTSSTHDQGSSSTLGSSSAYGMHSGQHLRLSELMHAPVQGKDGKQLGHIRDFTIDPQSGRIQFAILSLGAASGTTSGSTIGTTGTSGSTTGTSSSTTRSATDLSQSSSGLASGTTGYGATGKLIPVPWQLFSESWTGTSSSRYGSSSTTGTAGTAGTTGAVGTMGTPTLTLNVDETKLESAPSFQAGNWSELQQSTFAHQVYSHFGVSSSSATGMPGSSISGEGTSGSRSYGGSSTHGSSSGTSGTSGSSTQPK
jgi:sporulation protein YlmC with PRC-barrel domain